MAERKPVSRRAGGPGLLPAIAADTRQNREAAFACEIEHRLAHPVMLDPDMGQVRARPRRRLIIKLAIALIFRLRRAVGDDRAGGITLVQLDAMAIEFVTLVRNGVIEFLASRP